MPCGQRGPRTSAPPSRQMSELLDVSFSWETGHGTTEAQDAAWAPAESNGTFPVDMQRDSTSFVALADIYF